MNYPHIAQRIFNQPLLMDPTKLQIMLEVLGPRFSAGELPDVAAGAERREFPSAAADYETRGYYLGAARLGFAPAVSGGTVEQHDPKIAVLSVTGSLVNRMAMEPPSSMTSFERLKFGLQKALADEAVKGAMLRIESPGGEVSGAWDAADALQAFARQKPLWASVDDNAMSAAYLLASQAQKIFITRSGAAGSIGVIAMHFDLSRMNAQRGIVPTVVTAGRKKAWMSPHSPLDQEAAGWLQQLVDASYSQFVDYVAAGRRMTADAVRATEAGVYVGHDAIQAGLADQIGTFDDAISQFQQHLRGPVVIVAGKGGQTAETPKKEVLMDNPVTDVKASEQAAAAPPTAPVPTVDASAAERTRINAILTCEEAKGREQLAQHLALRTSTAADDAKAILAAAPVATPAAPAGNPLAEAMARVKNPQVGAGGADSENNDGAQLASIGALYQQMRGIAAQKEVR